MSCYYPWVAQIRKDFRDDTYDDRFSRKRVRFIGQFDLEHDLEDIKCGKSFLIPCGKCLGCRLDYARRWSDRLVLEMDSMKKGVFLTLTYENSELPSEVDPNTGELFDHVVRVNEQLAPVAPLVKFHVSEFLKRLRARLNYKASVLRFEEEWPELINNPSGSPKVLLKFFAAGEYGELRHRPHYHVILFGISAEDLQYLGDMILHERNELGQETYRSEFLEDVWKKGIVGVSEANYLTMGYTARYTVKKALGNDYPVKYGLPDEFTLMSRNPGIGASFLRDHPGKVDEVSTWYDHGKEIYWPKYLLEKEHEHFVNIHVLEPDGYLSIVRYRYLDSEYLEKKSFRSSLVTNSLINTYEIDERPFSQKRDFLVRQKISSVKKLVRGDVTLN